MKWMLQFRDQRTARIVIDKGNYAPGLTAVCGYIEWAAATDIVEAHNRTVEQLEQGKAK